MSSPFAIALRCVAAAVVFTTILIATSGAANAMLCELDDSLADDSLADDSLADDSLADDSLANDSLADDSAWSSKIAAVAAPVVFNEKPPKRRCDSYDSIDCDLNRPEGAPQTPRPIVPRRPRAALAPSKTPTTALVGRPLAQTSEAGHERPGYYSELFRPPRRSPQSTTSH